jgi:CBS domain-containing protein
MEGGHVVGVVTRAELEAAVRAGGAGGRARLAEAAGLRVVYCFADSDVADAAATMRAARVSHLAVLGEDVRLLGLLARRDLPYRPCAGRRVRRPEPGRAAGREPGRGAGRCCDGAP